MKLFSALYRIVFQYLLLTALWEACRFQDTMDFHTQSRFKKGIEEKRTILKICMLKNIVVSEFWFAQCLRVYFYHNTYCGHIIYLESSGSTSLTWTKSSSEHNYSVSHCINTKRHWSESL